MKLTSTDLDAIDSFANFLSWKIAPRVIGQPIPPRPAPPAWFAYSWGYTTYCPPKDVL